MVGIQKIKKMGINLVLHKVIFKIDKKIELFCDKIPQKLKIRLTKKRIERVLFDRSLFHNQKQLFLLDAVRQRQMLLEGRYYWLGLNGRKIPQDTWNIDFISGYKWENAYFQNIQTVDITRRADVKIPWELSRLQHLYVFAEAYMLTGEKSNVDYIKQQLQSWIQLNPYKNSVNWTCSMEVAIRAINIVFLLLIMPEELMSTEEEKKELLTLLYLHGKYIAGNLENYDKYNNNHYLSDLLGLLWVGSFLSDYTDGKTLKECKKWVAFANKELKKEMDIQVNEDGTDFESSVAYHRLVVEIYLLYAYINKIYEREIDQFIITRIDKMIDFLVAIRKPDGKLPMIGDVDDGRILILEKYSTWDRRSCDFLLDRRSQYLSGKLFGDKEKLPAIQDKSICFRDGGYYLLRNAVWYCMIHCGPLSMRGHGGHSHNDQLAIVLNIEGRDFLIDPGVGCYSGNVDLRNKLRSTEAHSTLRVVGMEQNELIPERLFEMSERTFSRCMSFDDISFCGQHQGYSEQGVIHERNVRMLEDELIIVDHIKCADDEIEISEDLVWELNYILDSNVGVQIISKRELILRHKDVYVQMSCDLDLSIEEMDISYSYGRTTKSSRLKTDVSCLRTITTKFKVLNGGK